MTTTRRTQQPRKNRDQPPKADEPISITKPLPGSTSYSDEPKVQLERIGDVLKRMREQRGDDLQYIADYLCIRRNFLEALENSHYDELPADAYVIGFLRSYANYLGTDGKEAIDRYRNEMAGRRNKPTLVLPTPISEGRTPSAIIMAGAAIAALLIYVMWYGLSTSDRTVVSTPPALPSTTVAETPPPASIPSADTTAPAALLAPPPADSGIMLSSAAPPATTGLPPAVPTATPPATLAPLPDTTRKAAQPATQNVPGGQVLNDTAKDSRVAIRALQSSWVLITDTHGQTVFDHVMKPGEVYKVPNKPNLMLTTGNGSGIALTLDGVDLPRLATGNSHAMRNIPLDSDHLRNLPPTPDE
jgi:cytoskeleton protein RodZ